MSRRVNRLSRKAGLAPGSLVHVGREKSDTVRISVIDYDANDHRAWEPQSLDEIVPLSTSSSVSWINVDGIHDVDLIARIGELFRIHPLILEDIVHSGQRPKFEDLGDQVYVVLRMLEHGEGHREVDWDQLSMIIGPNYLLTFQERAGDIFDVVRQRIAGDRGRIRRHGPDYLAYALIDVAVDYYFVVLERIGDRIEALEASVVQGGSQRTLADINRLRRGVLTLRRSVWPLREVVSALQRSDSPLIHEGTRPYLRDIYDHTAQIVDTVETFRDMLSAMVEIYMSSLSNRMNEIMKVLTMIATVFIPLTFVVGVYGMNFDHMPELHWKYGYAAVWAAMLLVALGMLYYFRKKKWFE